MIDHLSVGQALPEDARRVLLAMHDFHVRHDMHPTLREILATAGMNNYDKMYRMIQRLIDDRLVERKAVLKARNLRVTSLGRGVVGALIGYQQAVMF